MCLIGLIIINHQIALRFLSADGKTRAWFGIIEMFFNYKYLLIIPIVISSIFIVKGIKKKENKKIIIYSIILSITALICVFLRIWRLMI
jgi:hypothetical protein